MVTRLFMTIRYASFTNHPPAFSDPALLSFLRFLRALFLLALSLLNMWLPLTGGLFSSSRLLDNFYSSFRSQLKAFFFQKLCNVIVSLVLIPPQDWNFFFYKFILFLFIFGCVGSLLSLVAASRGYSSLCGLLIVVASLVAEHGL